jgi:hypothetical protein
MDIACIAGRLFPPSKRYELYIGDSICVDYLANILSNVRTFIDRRLGYQKVGVFKVKAVLNLWTRKLIFMNDGHFLMLRRNDVGFTALASGQVAEIERTATHQLTYYRIS